LRLIGFYRILLVGMKIKQTVLALSLLIGLGGLFIGPVASAGTCAGTNTLILNCSQSGGKSSDPSTSGVWGLLLLAINILTAGVGIAAVAGIVIGSFMYMTAGGAPDRMKKANLFLVNVILGIVAYAAMWAFLNFIIPGGLFS
jgi:hypothetical protein